MSINYTISSKALEVEKSKVKAGQTKKTSGAKKRVKSVDGVSRANTKAAKALAPKPKVAPVAVVKKPTMQDIVHSSGAHQGHHPVQRSQTLMRSAVHKPQVAKKPHITVPVERNGAIVKAVVPAKLSVAEVDTKRLQHAQAIPKSKLVTRFNDTGPAYVPVVPTQLAPSIAQPIMTPAPAQVSHQTDMFTAALHAATSHQQPPVKQHFKKQHKSRAHRILAVSGAALFGVVLIGLVVSQNMTNIRLQLASAKAGFSATLPGSQPSGYGVKNFSASSNIVTAHYKSNSDSDRQFTITEKPSTWDSATLRESYVKQITPNYQVVEEGGRTIFIYNNNTATWVNGGIWYTIDGANTLTNKQLIDLATSM